MQGLLIGGTSHCGKSTLAAAVGAALDWSVRSADALARHPGRPWLNVPKAVEEFYETLSDETIYWFLRVHHTNIWPLVVNTIQSDMANTNGFVFEGSALRPESLAVLDDKRLLSICLYAKPDFLVNRVRSESGYADRDERQRLFIDKFITRSLRDNIEMRQAALDKRVWLIDVTDTKAFEQTTRTLLEALRGGVSI